MRYLSLDSSYINNKYFSFNDSKFNIFNVNQHVMINNPKQLNAQLDNIGCSLYKY